MKWSGASTGISAAYGLIIDRIDNFIPCTVGMGLDCFTLAFVAVFVSTDIGRR
jgi:hypothetical protein